MLGRVGPVRCESAPQRETESTGSEGEGSGLRDPRIPASAIETQNDDEPGLERVRLALWEGVGLLCHCPPCPLYASLCRLLALCLGSGHPLTTGRLLTQSLGITARHQMGQNLHRKALRQRKVRGTDLVSSLQGLSLGEQGEIDLDPQDCYLSELQSAFEFSASDPRDRDEAFRHQLENIPQDTVVCVLTLARVRPRGRGEVLLLCRLEKGRDPLTVQIPTEGLQVTVSSLLAEFDTILKEQKEISNVTELKAWWEGRTSLDQRMKALVESLETGVLGCWKGLLLPPCPLPLLQQEAASLTHALRANGNQQVTEELIAAALSASHRLSPEEILSLARGLAGNRGPEVGERLRDIVERLGPLTGDLQSPAQIILMLDKDLQRLPWETIPLLKGQRVSRLPSFHFLLGYMVTRKHQLKSVLKDGIDPGNVFYVLNPQGNLPNTEKTFKAWFQRKAGWDGVVGRGPSQEQLRTVLCNRDLYVYAGHGAGVRFLEGQEIQKLSCRAASLLVGCSSASLALRGELEGAGIVLQYLMAGCPLFLGNLWDVTDKDIDRYMEHLLKGWLGSRTPDGSSLLDHLSRARQAPKLKYLIGASPVVYGLNVCLR